MNPVFMFSGQGAQKPGMGADLLGVAEVAQTFAIAGEVCGVDIAALAREGSAEQYNNQDNGDGNPTPRENRIDDCLRRGENCSDRF